MSSNRQTYIYISTTKNKNGNSLAQNTCDRVRSPYIVLESWLFYDVYFPLTFPTVWSNLSVTECNFNYYIYIVSVRCILHSTLPSARIVGRRDAVNSHFKHPYQIKIYIYPIPIYHSILYILLIRSLSLPSLYLYLSKFRKKLGQLKIIQRTPSQYHRAQYQPDIRQQRFQQQQLPTAHHDTTPWIDQQ